MDTPEENQPAPKPVLTEEHVLQYKEKLKLEQNLPFAFAGGTAAALVGGIIWALITVSSGYQIGWMAVGVGFLVGFSVRFLGKGIDKVFGIVGASLALVGCLLGNFFSLIGFAAKQENLGIFNILASIDYSMVPDVMIEAFSPMDLLFYGIAIYEGYRFSFRQVTEEEVMQNME